MDPRRAMPCPSHVVCPDSAFDWLPPVAFLFLTCNPLDSAYQSRHDHSALAFVSFAYSNVLMLFFCLRRLEKLAPDDPPKHKKRALAAVWVLATAHDHAFAWLVAEIVPSLLAVAMAGIYVLIIYPHADGDSGRSMVPASFSGTYLTST